MRFDRTGKRLNWESARKAEGAYTQRLRTVAKQVGDIVKGFAPDGQVKDIDKLMAHLRGYAELIGPWSLTVANYMVADVWRRNERLWGELSRDIGRGLRAEIAHSAQGAVYREMLQESAGLIQSLPTKAAERVYKLTQEGMVTGRRAESIAQEILASGKVTESRARLIARTSVSTTAANFVQARAQAAGSEGYFWRTSKDADVRETHQQMEGVYVRWSSPPKTDKSLDPYHAGCGPNCRCFADPVFPDL